MHAQSRWRRKSDSPLENLRHLGGADEPFEAHLLRLNTERRRQNRSVYSADRKRVQPAATFADQQDFDVFFRQPGMNYHRTKNSFGGSGGNADHFSFDLRKRFDFR